jgi:hypothetical protein
MVSSGFRGGAFLDHLHGGVERVEILATFL